MARWDAIRAVSNAMRDVLESARVGTPFPAIDVTVVQTSDFAALPAEGVTIYLYRVAIHSSLRNLPARSDGRNRVRPSLPLDLHFLVTPWAKTAGRQHELLGWLIRALEDQPVLPTAILNRDGQIFADGETVDVVAQPLTPVDAVAVWEFNKAIMQPSMTYVARMVLLDSSVPMATPKMVVTRSTQSEGVRP